MARPVKVGLDYFPHSCIPDKKMKIIRAKFGITGYAVIMLLYENLFWENGYFLEWTNDVALIFSDENHLGVNVVSEIVKECLKRDIFNKDLFYKYNILTSAEIQETYLEITTRLKRKQIKFIKEYLLIDCTNFSENVVINSIKSVINPIKSADNQQKKRNEKKRNEKKVKESCLQLKITLKDNSQYVITSQMINDYQQIYKNIDVLQSLRKLTDYLNRNNDNRRDISGIENYINLWLEQDNMNVNGRSNNQNKYISEKPAKKYVEGVDYF